MTFKDKNGNEVIKLENFNKRYNSEPVFLETKIVVNFDGLSVSETLEFELTDFQDLKLFLERVEQGISKFFTFQNLEEQFKIYFEAGDPHYFDVSGFLKNKMYTSELKFSFQLPKTEISFLVISLEQIVATFQNE